MFSLKSSLPSSSLRAIARVHTRFISYTPAYLTKNAGFDKKKIDNEESLMEKAPNWNESTATESEADIKADQEPTPSPEILQKESAEWIKAHNKQSK